MSVELRSLVIEFSFVCDDVRREDNGKLMFIGVYANNILLKEFPTSLRLHLVTRLMPKRPDFDLAYRVKVNGEAFLIMKSHLSGGDLSAETSPSPPFVIQINEAGLLEIEVIDAAVDLEEADSLNWTPLFKIPVECHVAP